MSPLSVKALCVVLLLVLFVTGFGVSGTLSKIPFEIEKVIRDITVNNCSFGSHIRMTYL